MITVSLVATRPLIRTIKIDIGLLTACFMRLTFVILIFICTKTSGQTLLDSLQSFVKSKSRYSDSYFITFEIRQGYPDFSDFVSSKNSGKVHVFNEAFVFEIKDFAISSWRIIKGYVEGENNIEERDIILVSNRNENFSGTFDFKEMVRNIGKITTDEILPGISIEIRKSGDTLYRKIMLLHSDELRIGIWRAGAYASNYEFNSEDVATIEDIESNGRLRNLNYKYNLQTLQYRLYEWIRRNSVDKKGEYKFL